MRQETCKTISMKRKQRNVALAALLSWGLASPLTWGAGNTGKIEVTGTLFENTCDIEINGGAHGYIYFDSYPSTAFTDGNGTAAIKVLTIRTETCALVGGVGKAHIVVNKGAATEALQNGAVFTNETGNQTAGFMLREIGVTTEVTPAWSGPLTDFYSRIAPDVMRNGELGPGHDVEDEYAHEGELTSGSSLSYGVGFVATDGVTPPIPGDTFTANLVFTFEFK